MVAGCALEVVLCAEVVNRVSYQEPPVDKFGEELVHGAEGMESLLVGWPVNGVELRCCPGIFSPNVFLNHWGLGLMVNALLNLGSDGSSVQVDLGSSTCDDGYDSQVQRDVQVVVTCLLVGIYIQLGQ